MAEGRVVIADAGPLNALSRIEALDLLERLFRRVLLTEQVREEVLPAADYRGKASIAVALDQGWLELVSPVARGWEPLNPAIDSGEHSAIAAALQFPDSRLVLVIAPTGQNRSRSPWCRDHRYRRHECGLAKLRGLIPAARPLLESLAPAGYFIHPSVIETVLGDPGE